jgi:energy-coupling factor transporter ATP-binding protein EcfA2
MPGGIDPCSQRGSLWHRWDPHIHAPGTLRNDQFKGDWETYIGLIEKSTPRVEALGVADYFCIETYKEVRRRKREGRLRDARLIFPNVEMRLNLETGKGKAINIHLLFSPDDPNHEDEIERLLAQLTFHSDGRDYSCTHADLELLGRAFDNKLTDSKAAVSAGANQFKTSLNDLRAVFRKDKWLRNNCLVAISGGLSDGTSGLQQDDTFTVLRHELEAFAHIIFSATPSSREFWLGKKPGFGVEHIERTYGSLKPCLHGSDAHDPESVAAPALNRYCWIKADLIFDGLRQAVIEPEGRVYLGENPPSIQTPYSVTELRGVGTIWLDEATIEVNGGLVAVIGSRGSGKTALVDMIAAGCSALGGALDESSFLRRAFSPVDLLGDSAVDLTWGDGTSARTTLRQGLEPTEWWDAVPASARYLSQHFVSRLCSSAGLATELREEMERVVFEATDSTDRMGANNFEELTSVSLESVRQARNDTLESIGGLSALIAHQDHLRSGLPKQRKERDELQKHIMSTDKELQALLPKGSAERAKRLAELQVACTNAELRIEQLKLRKNSLEALVKEVVRLRTQVEPSRLADLQRRFASAGLTAEQWQAFEVRFVGDVDVVLKSRVELVSGKIMEATEGNPGRATDKTKDPLPSWSLNLLQAERDALVKDVGVDAMLQKKYEQLQRLKAQHEAGLGRLNLRIMEAEDADGRQAKTIEERRERYAAVFDTFSEEEERLRLLYAPLEKQLKGARGALGKLRFLVKRNVDVNTWVSQGEDLVDLRSATVFKGRGGLQKIVESRLLQAWRTGGASDVASAMEEFRLAHKDDILKARPAFTTAEEVRAWLHRVGDWLYGTDHISIRYGIEYDGVAIEQLSPGTRGIVLLLLYLAIDRVDTSPLIIDQPEENLDPHSVFRELVPHFREARTRRQIIIVTHNANLVVNTDADQVIVARSVQGAGGGLPQISYECGSLENPDIRRAVCETLEGGERAFLERERRYRIRWEETMGRLPM